MYHIPIYQIIKKGDLHAPYHLLKFPFLDLVGGGGGLLSESDQIVYATEKEKISKVLFFQGVLCTRLMFRHRIRLSFKSKEMTDIVYDISFSKDFSSCEAHLYRIEGDRLFFCQHTQSKLVDKKQYIIKHSIFGESYARLLLSVFLLKDGIYIEGKDRQGNTPLTFCTWDLVFGLIERFKAYLHQMLTPSHLIAQKIFLEKLHALVHNMSSEDEASQEKTLDSLASSLSFYFPLLMLRSYILQNNPTDKERQLIKKFTKKFIKEKQTEHSEKGSEPEPAGHRLMKKNVFFFIQRELAKEPANLLSSYIDFKDFNYDFLKSSAIYLLQFQHNTTKKNKIEITINYPPEDCNFVEFFGRILESRESEFNTFVGELDYIKFIINGKGTFGSYTFHTYVDPSKKVCFELETDSQHVLVNPLGNLFFLEVNNFNHVSQLLYADSATHVYRREYKCMKDGREERSGLFGTKLTLHQENGSKFVDTIDNSLKETVDAIRDYLGGHPDAADSFHQILFDISSHGKVSLSDEEFQEYCNRTIEKHTEALRTNKVKTILFRYLLNSKMTDSTLDAITIKYQNNTGYFYAATTDKTVNAIEARRQKAQQNGGTWCYDIPDLLAHVAGEFRSAYGLSPIPHPIRSGFVELDVDPSSVVSDPKTGLIDYNKGSLIPALGAHGEPRRRGENQAGVVIGVQTDDIGVGFPLKRFLIMGDLTHVTKGAITMQECMRINLALAYAYKHGWPVDWFTASFGVEIHHDRGVENLDASASTCREIIHYAQDLGLPINIVVSEVNIGAQSYWDSLAAICQETHGTLIMTRKGTMSLTGPKALTSAFYTRLHSEDIPAYSENLFPEGLHTLAGYRQIHGPNGEALQSAQDLKEACSLLTRHHYYTYSKDYARMASERPAAFYDPIERNIMKGGYLNDQNDIGKELQNIMKGMKADRHAIIEALRDQYSPPPLYLWGDAKGCQLNVIEKGHMAQTASTIVAEIVLGKRPVMLIFPPLGPLTPLDSEIIAKAICKATGKLPVVILGNLTGFNSDPLSMQNKQLTEGAMIVRSIVHYEGAMVIVNLGYMVGGAYVAFSQQLNPRVKIIAVEGAKAQVVGGNIAAKVVFTARIRKKAEKDPRLVDLKKNGIKTVEGDSRIETLFRTIIGEIEVEEEKTFNDIHDVKRAQKVGAVDTVISPENLRYEIINKIEEILVSYKIAA